MLTDIFIMVLAIIAAFIFTIVSIRQRNLLKWLPAYIIFAISTVISVFEVLNQELVLTTTIFQAIAALLICIGVLIEYYETFIKTKNYQRQNKKYLNVAGLMSSPLILGLEVFMIIFLFITTYMLLKIYRQKRTPTHAFLCCSLFTAIIWLVNKLLDPLDIGEIADPIMSSFCLALLITGLVALLEQKLLQANEALIKVFDTSSQVSINTANIATELAASASEVNTASDEISSTTLEIANRAQKQVKLFLEINEKSKEMYTMAQSVLTSTDEINQIMVMITKLSDRTNLLAINANIQATRADVYGRGFGVIADEVRRLAEESKEADYETGKGIEDITSKIKVTVHLIENITNQIVKATVSIEENSMALEGISASSEQQSASMEEISVTANKLGDLGEELKNRLVYFGNGKTVNLGKEKDNRQVKQLKYHKEDLGAYLPVIKRRNLKTKGEIQ